MDDIKDLAPLKSQISKLEKLANEVQITTQEENESALNLKSKLKEIGKEITKRKEGITKPLNEALKNARALFSPIEDQYENAENIVGKKLIAYKQKVEAENLEKEAKIAERVEKGTMKIETAERKLDEIKTPEKTITTAHGQVQFRKIAKIRITNENIIPQRYWIIDQVLLRKDVLSDIVVPGVEKYYEETV